MTISLIEVAFVGMFAITVMNAVSTRQLYNIVDQHRDQHRDQLADQSNDQLTIVKSQHQVNSNVIETLKTIIETQNSITTDLHYLYEIVLTKTSNNLTSNERFLIHTIIKEDYKYTGRRLALINSIEETPNTQE